MLSQLIPKPLRRETCSYYSTLPPDQLKANIRELFDKTKGFNFSINLTGDFTSDNEFEVAPKWQAMVIKNSGDSSVAKIQGAIAKDDVYGTQVNFTVKPNSVFTLFFFLGPVIGLIGLYTVLTNDNVQGTTYIGLVFPFLMSLFMLAAAQGAKKNLRARFVQVFDLQPATPVSPV